MARMINPIGSVESSAALSSLVDGAAAYMDYDSGTTNARFGAKGGAGGSVGVLIRTLLAGAAVSAIALSAAGAMTANSTLSASSGTDVAATIATTVNQSGTASYVGLSIDATQSATGSGTKTLIRARVGGTTKWSVDNSGNVSAVGNISLGSSPPSVTAGDEVVLAGGSIRAKSDIYASKSTATLIQFQFSNSSRSYSMQVSAGGVLQFADNSAGATMLSLTNTSAIFGGTATTFGSAGGNLSVQFGPNSPSADNQALMTFQPSNAAFNWTLAVNSSFGGSGSMAFVPSSAAGGTSFTTPSLILSGAGSVIIGNAALATNATAGFLYIPTCAGAPSGTPTAFTGRVPLVYDSTNNFLYVYTSGAWKKSTVYA